jgi:hypothetical protein
MADESLFSDRDRVDARPSGYAESMFAFLERVDSPVFARVRGLMEIWLARVPDGERKRLMDSLRAPDNDQQLRAFWELYVGEALRRSGYHLDWHPVVAGVDTSPDFFATLDASSLYIEATSAWRKQSAKDEEDRAGQLVDRLQGLPVKQFALNLHMEVVGPADLDPENISDPVVDWVEALDRNVVARQLAEEAAGVEGRVPHFRVAQDGWVLDFSPIPVSSPPSRAIGMSSRGEAVLLDVRGTIQRSYAKKAGRYGELNNPYLVALTDLGEVPSPIDMVADVFYGTTASIWDQTSRSMGPPFRKRDGLWLDESGPVDQHVSGVVIAWGLRPSSLMATVPVVIINPWTLRPVKTPLPWQVMTLGHDGVSLVNTAVPADAAELFELDRGWPARG